MTIRFLIETDKKPCIELLEEFYESNAVSHKIPKEYMEHTIDFALTNNVHNKIIICKINDNYAGFCHLSFAFSCEVGGLVLIIEEIYVRDEFQGQGLGTAIFDFIRCEYEGKVKRYRLEVMSDNAPAIKLYKRLGFKDLDYKQMILDL